MRRAWIVCFAFCFLLLAGCSSGGKTLAAQDIDFAFSCKADVSAPDGNFECAFNRAGKRDASVEILSGNGRGLKWYWDGDGFRQNYRGLSAECETCVLPDGAFASVLVRALDCAESPNALERLQDNTFSGVMSGCGFTLAADGNTGKIQTLSVPDWNLTIRFHNYSEPVLETYAG